MSIMSGLLCLMASNKLYCFSNSSAWMYWRPRPGLNTLLPIVSMKRSRLRLASVNCIWSH
jgi:hypothetical protein